MDKKEKKIWYEGQKKYNIIFTEEDLKSVMIALESKCAGNFAEKQNEYDKAKTRILFQMSCQ